MMECEHNQETVVPVDSILCEVCTDLQEATSRCDECLINLCDRCVQSHEETGKGRHHIERGVSDFDMEVELCPVDGQKMSFFCRSCFIRVCPECELNRKRHVMHSVVTLTEYVGKEKEKLLDRLDDVTTKTETISYLPEDIKCMSTQIELKWLERKELIRQEFISLYETITTRQQQLLADMEEEVRLSLQLLGKLQQTHETVLSTTCQLSDDCISAVQNLPRDQFMKSYPQFLESVKELESKVDRMDSAEECMPGFLQLPFSLHWEKVHLDTCLQFKAFSCQHIKPKEYNRFIPHDRLKDKLSVGMLLHTPIPHSLPPSSIIRYNVEIFHGSRHSKEKPVWVSQKALRSVDNVINGSQGFRLAAGSMYLLKFRPTITCTTHQGYKSVDGKAVTVVLVTDMDAGPGASSVESMLCSDDSQASADNSRLLGSDTDSCYRAGAAVSFSNTAVAGDSNSNNNSCDNSSSNIIRRSCRRNRRCISDLRTSSLGERLLQVPGSVSGTAALSRGYSCDVSGTPAGLAFPVPEQIYTPLLGRRSFFQCQQRYLADCSFEEARLMEDTHLKLSRMILFDV